MLLILGILLNIIILFLGIWGTACFLVMGKRLIKSPAGRTRSSFKLVRKQGAHLIVPLFLTIMLRICITLLWSLLLIVPGIIYYIRTSFFGIVIAYEGKGYRSALNRSKDIVKGHTWIVFLYFVGIALTVSIPTTLVVWSLASLILLDERLVYAITIVGTTVSAMAQLLALLTTILLFKHVETLPKVQHP